jgi:hypothetical protein
MSMGTVIINIGIGISMSKLKDTVRAIQIILLNGLVNCDYPPIVQAFYQNIFMLTNIDIL